MLVDLNSFKFSRILNSCRIISAYGKKRSILRSHPAELIVEVTNYCNLACVMCPRNTMKRSKGYMEMAVFKKIIDEVKGYIDLVYLSGGLGEPLLHPEIFSMISYCVANNVRVGISTNATLLMPPAAQALVKSAPDIVLLSLDGATKETHESIRVGSSFERTMANVEYFLNEKIAQRRPSIYTVAQLVYMDENKNDVKEFYLRWKHHRGINDVRLKKFLRLKDAEKHQQNTKKSDGARNFSCILPWRQLSVAWDGSVGLCCLDMDFRCAVGNISTQSVNEIWNCEKMVAYRRLLSAGKKDDIPICRNCATIKTSPLTRLGSVIFDSYSIRKILPIIEKIVLKTGIKLMDYE